MGITIKVETQGTEGAKNVLGDEEISQATGVILATDRFVDTTRFQNHLNVIDISTQKAIKNPKKFLEEVLNLKGKKLKPSNTQNSEEQTQTSDFPLKELPQKLYKAILTGVSYMLPFVVFGGIMIGIAFLIDLIAGNESAGGNFGSVNQAASWFMKVGGTVFSLIVPILAAYISYALVGKLGLLPGFLVGLISNGNLTDFYKEILRYKGDNFTSNSGFFGAIFGGFLVAVILIVLLKMLAKMPKNLNGIKMILIVPLLGTLVIGAAFFFLNIPLIYVNIGFTKFLNYLNKKPELAILLGMILGALMGTDLGGPINKAAYVFGVTSLSAAVQGGTLAMASVMAAGMVPPLGIAISTLVSKKIWDKEQRLNGFSNWVFGLTFISEGAIPFTAAKPKYLVPANIIGSSFAGLLTAVFQVKLAAPHGGIFVAPLMKSMFFQSSGTQIGMGIVFFLISILAGAMLAALIIFGLWKYDQKKLVKKQVVSS